MNNFNFIVFEGEIISKNREFGSTILTLENKENISMLVKCEGILGEKIQKSSIVGDKILASGKIENLGNGFIINAKDINFLRAE